jgi:hypothetical protein
VARDIVSSRLPIGTHWASFGGGCVRDGNPKRLHCVDLLKAEIVEACILYSLDQSIPNTRKLHTVYCNLMFLIGGWTDHRWRLPRSKKKRPTLVRLFLRAGGDTLLFWASRRPLKESRATRTPSPRTRYVLICTEVEAMAFSRRFGGCPRLFSGCLKTWLIHAPV